MVGTRPGYWHSLSAISTNCIALFPVLRWTTQCMNAILITHRNLKPHRFSSGAKLSRSQLEKPESESWRRHEDVKLHAETELNPAYVLLCYPRFRKYSWKLTKGENCLYLYRTRNVSLAWPSQLLRNLQLSIFIGQRERCPRLQQCKSIIDKKEATLALCRAIFSLHNNEGAT